MNFVLGVIVLGVILSAGAAQQNINPLSPYPYLVGICASNSSEKCHGILVSKNKVLTAGHCLAGLKEVRVYIADPGTNNSCAYNEHGYTVNSSFIKLHEKYTVLKNNAIENDIAMIKLPQHVNLTNFKVGILTKVPLKTYYNKNITIHNSTANNIRVEVGTNVKCNEIFKNVFFEKQQGCVLAENEESFDQNGFPLELNGTVFGFTTIDPLGRFGALFVDVFAYYKWINHEINSSNMTLACFVMTLLCQILLLIVSK